MFVNRNGMSKVEKLVVQITFSFSLFVVVRFADGSFQNVRVKKLFATRTTKARKHLHVGGDWHTRLMRSDSSERERIFRTTVNDDESQKRSRDIRE